MANVKISNLPVAVSVNGADTFPMVQGGTTKQASLNTMMTSPTMVTPTLGTPVSGTLTNCTGLPVSTGVSGLGTGVATFLGTPSSANLRAALTDETGTGAAVFATSPTLVTPALGTPSSGTLTSCTGLPLTTGVTGTLPQANGGTGKSSWGNNRIVYTGTAGTISESANFTWNASTSVFSIRSLTISQGGSNVVSNIAIGQSGVLGANTTGTDNVAIGSTFVLEKNTDGYSNCAIGGLALRENTSGQENIAVGVQALENCTTGYKNIAIGTTAGNAVTSGYGNTIIGDNAGGISAGYNNIIIGSGATASGGNNEITLGSSSINAFRVPGLSWTGGVNYINLGSTTVATLPAAADAGEGARAFVSDATGTTFRAIVAGGGSNKVPVFSDGTNWRIG